MVPFPPHYQPLLFLFWLHFDCLRDQLSEDLLQLAQPHYLVSDTPRQLDHDDMAFIVEYTKDVQVDALRQHVLRVWQRAKLEVWDSQFRR